MKKYYTPILILSSVMTLIAIGIIGLSYGWFSISRSITTNMVSVGDITYVKSGEWITTTDPIYPGLDLIETDFVLDNQSTISSQLRFKITYTQYTSIEDVTADLVNYSAINDHITATIPSEFVYANGYWYYQSDSYDINADSGLITLVTALSINGEAVGIYYASKPVSVTITVQVKQAEHVDWSDLTQYNFDTGYTTP